MARQCTTCPTSLDLTWSLAAGQTVEHSHGDRTRTGLGSSWSKSTSVSLNHRSSLTCIAHQYVPLTDGDTGGGSDCLSRKASTRQTSTCVREAQMWTIHMSPCFPQGSCIACARGTTPSTCGCLRAMNWSCSCTSCFRVSMLPVLPSRLHARTHRGGSKLPRDPAHRWTFCMLSVHMYVRCRTSSASHTHTPLYDQGMDWLTWQGMCRERFGLHAPLRQGCLLTRCACARSAAQKPPATEQHQPWPYMVRLIVVLPTWRTHSGLRRQRRGCKRSSTCSWRTHASRKHCLPAGVCVWVRGSCQRFCCAPDACRRGHWTSSRCRRSTRAPWYKHGHHRDAASRISSRRERCRCVCINAASRVCAGTRQTRCLAVTLSPQGLAASGSTHPAHCTATATAASAAARRH
jgi:hypothetical protein